MTNIVIQEKKIQENINTSKISTVKTWSILRPSLFFIGRWTKVFGAEKGGKKFLMIGFIISRVHFIISVSKFSTVFKNFVRKFLDEIAIDLRSMIKRSVKICNALNMRTYAPHSPSTY
jgi:hypothetical protein